MGWSDVVVLLVALALFFTVPTALSRFTGRKFDDRERFDGVKTRAVQLMDSDAAEAGILVERSHKSEAISIGLSAVAPPPPAVTEPAPPPPPAMAEPVAAAAERVGQGVPVASVAPSAPIPAASPASGAPSLPLPPPPPQVEADTGAESVVVVSKTSPVPKRRSHHVPKHAVAPSRTPGASAEDPSEVETQLEVKRLASQLVDEMIASAHRGALSDLQLLERRRQVAERRAAPPEPEPARDGV